MRTLALLFLLAAPAAAQIRAGELTRGPYFVDASSTSARVCWRRGEGWAGDACRGFLNLAPGATFAYAIDGTGASWTGRSLAPRGAPLRFAVFGDTGRDNPEQLAVARALARWEPEFALHTGDVVYPDGKDKRYTERFFRPYADLLARVPFFPAIGNHDYGNHIFSRSKGERAYRKHWLRIHRRPAYYAFEAGDACFFAVDDNADGFGVDAGASLAEGSAQRGWLERALGGCGARWKIVFLHVPVYSSREHGDHEALQRLLEPLFTRHGVDIVFQGHVHWYERTEPIRGVVYVTSGAGGASLHDGSERRPWSQTVLRTYGFVGATLSGDALALEFIDAAGAVRDRATIKK